MLTARLAFLGVLGLCVIPQLKAPVINSVQDSAASSSAQKAQSEKLELFRWFDQFGYTERLKGRIVSLEDWRMEKGVERLSSRSYGFELPKNEYEFHMFSVDLDEMSEDDSDYAEIRLVPVELEKAVSSEIALQRKYEKEKGDFSGWSDDAEKRAPWYVPSEPFVWARAAELRGNVKLSDMLYDEAVRLAKREESGNLKAQLSDRISGIFCHEIMEQIKENVPFAKVRMAAARFLELLPDEESTPLVRDYIATIDAMAVLDREWTAKSKGSGTQAAIAELIYNLQNQTGGTFWSQGPASVFHEFDEENDRSAAVQLFNYGIEAVPQLIEALTDRRLTRAVSYNFMLPADGVLRVGDAAAEILHRIAPLGNPKYDEDWKKQQLEVQSAAKAWLMEVESKGEKTILVEGVLKGDERSRDFADRLAKKYPQVAVAVIARGMESAKDGDIRAEMLSVLLESKSSEARELFRRSLDNSEKAARLVAARYFVTDDAELIMSLLSREFNADRENEEVLDLLFQTHRLDALDLVMSMRSSLSDSARYHVVDALSETDSNLLRLIEETASSEKYSPLIKAIEKSLVVFLTDKERRVGLSGMSGDFSFEDPRICDMAAYYLSEMHPEKYKFKDLSSNLGMDRQCISFANTWRVENGLIPLPIPMQTVIKRVSDAILGPALDAYISEPSKANRSRIVSLGLGAIDGTLARAANLPLGKQRSALEEMTNSLASIVRQVDFRGPAPDKIRAKVANWKGEVLTANMFIDLMNELVKVMGRRSAGFRFEAEREEDLAGFAVRLTFGAPDLQKDATQVDYSSKVVCGVEALLNESGGVGSSFGSEWQDDMWPIALKAVFSAPPTKSIRIFHQAFQAHYE